MKIHVCLALTLIIVKLADSKDPRVNTPLGSIEGYWQESRNGRKYQAYAGIPYALPPVGELRFEPPQPVTAWEGQLQAKFPSSLCLQYAQATASREASVLGAEDCLYLNVYTPVDEGFKQSPRKLLPVIVDIHGGAFQQLTSFTQQPEYLMDKDVVFVTMNYRLGLLGFLSTEDGVVPGNMGLKDQSLAIKWVSQNIASFGGDPNRVTLTGLSAGGASVHLHYLSPMSRGLFHRGISLSGTAFDCWSQAENSLGKAKHLATLMRCPTSSTGDLIRCLKSRPGKTILAFERNFMFWLYNPFTPFGPVVEKNATNPFIDKSPIDIINRGEAANLPWITSIVTEEGLYPAAEFILNKKRMKELDEKWETIAPHLLDFYYTIPRSKQASVARDIRRHYMGDKPIELGNVSDLIRMLSDRLFGVDAEKAVKSQTRANSSPVWFYYFGYRGEFSLSDLFTGTKQNFGVSHADDNQYVISGLRNTVTSSQDIRMSHDMVNLWTSFATTGSPNLGTNWPTVNGSSAEFRYLRISGPGQFSVESSANFRNKTFWSSINFNENILTSN